MTNLTKQALADSLKRLLTHRTLDRITVQDVAEGAGISRKTFYYHFHDIYDLVEWLLTEETQQLEEHRDGDDAQAWVRALAAALSYAEGNRRWVLNLYKSMDRDQLNRILRDIIAPRVEAHFDWALRGRPIHPQDRKFALDILTYGIAGLLLSWLGEGMPQDILAQQSRLSGFVQDSVQSMADHCVQNADRQEEAPAP